MLGKIRYYKTTAAHLRAVAEEDKMVNFMLSEAGKYNGKAHVAALSALDHARDYSEGTLKNTFWYNVSCRLEYASLDLINIDKIGG